MAPTSSKQHGVNVGVNASAAAFQQAGGYGSHGYSTGEDLNANKAVLFSGVMQVLLCGRIPITALTKSPLSGVHILFHLSSTASKSINVGMMRVQRLGLRLCC